MSELYHNPDERIKVPRFCEENGFYTTKAKSNQMAKIKGKNSKPELRLRLSLWNLGIRYRKNGQKLPGRPDIVLRQHKLVIFVDGSFWHGFNWEKRRETIKSNRMFWIPKIERNMQRDREVNKQLHQMGYTVMRFWDHEINKELGRCVSQILRFIDRTG
ncbi:MAG: very short patch repair endonuclease [Breznakibacter sp.]